MYMNFWYPVCSSVELTSNAPLRVKILGLNFATFRDSDGNAHVLADTCVHRGGSLSKGKVVGNCIECPYHGWQYAGDGHCTHIPTLRSGKPPARARVDSYPVVERYGIVFAFLGDLPENERAPFYEIAEWEQPGWRSSGLAVIELKAYFERSIENGLDPVHNEFVHTLQGNIRFRPEHMTVSENTWGSTVFVRMDPPKAGTTQLEFLRNDLAPEHFGASSGHYGPNTLETRINLSKENNFARYATAVLTRHSLSPVPHDGPAGAGYSIPCHCILQPMNKGISQAWQARICNYMLVLVLLCIAGTANVHQ